jgi:hypothetical protein
MQKGNNIAMPDFSVRTVFGSVLYCVCKDKTINFGLETDHIQHQQIYSACEHCDIPVKIQTPH